MAETSLETLPQDLQMKILSLLPLKSLMSWVLVSKKWASLIRGKKFRDEYLLRSMTKPQMLLIDYPFRRSVLSLGLHSLIRPRPSGLHTALFHSLYQEEKPLLFMDRNLKLKANEDDLLFHSVYQQEKPLLSSGQQTMRISLDPDNEISKPIRGLISIREKTKVEICNSGIEKRLPLPVIQAPEGAVIRTYFGYDDVDDVFKVLCVMQMKSKANEYQVLTVRSSEESWTKITCEHDHTPVTEGLCKGGVLYYGAWSNSDESLVVSFNVHTQKFNATKLPEEVNINVFWKLVNYNGGIALVNDAASDLHKNGNLQLWVRKDTDAGDWEKNPIIEISGWNEMVGNCRANRYVFSRGTETAEVEKFYFKGTIGTGELVFAKDYMNMEQSFFVLYYDTVTKNHKRFTIKEVAGGELHDVRTFLNHVDSPMLI